MLGLVDDAHAAFAELVQQAIGSDGRSRRIGGARSVARFGKVCDVVFETGLKSAAAASGAGIAYDEMKIANVFKYGFVYFYRKKDSDI